MTLTGERKARKTKGTWRAAEWCLLKTQGARAGPLPITGPFLTSQAVTVPIVDTVEVV